MHELGLMNGVLQTALAEARRASATRITALNLVLQDDGHSDQADTVCPQCGSPASRGAPAHEFYLESIEVE